MHMRKLDTFENTLKLHTNKDELLESEVNELFQKTEVLELQVDGMNDLVQVIVESMRPPQHSLYYLRVLTLINCADLRYVFTVAMASGLVKLERLSISNCRVMEVVVCSENGGAELIKFQKLKYLELVDLPKLVGLSNTSNVVELPQLVELKLVALPNFTTIYPENSSSSSSDISAIQSFIKKEVVIPKLEILTLERMEKLKSIWASCEMISGSSNEVVRSAAGGCLLRDIRVSRCDSVVNDLFPTNPMPLLRRLERIEVESCGSIEVLFNIDVRSCVNNNIGEIEEEEDSGSCSSSLRSIDVFGSPKFKEVWRLKGIIPSAAADDYMIISWFKAVETIYIRGCKRFRNLFTPTATVARFDLGALSILHLEEVKNFGDNDKVVQRRQAEVNVISTEERLQADDNITNVAFPFHLIPIFHHLQKLSMWNVIDVEVVFEIESRDLAIITQNNQQPSKLLPHLKVLHLYDMENMKYVWKCNWNDILFTQKKGESSFQNLTSIRVKSCKNIKYLFSPFMIKLLSNLQTLSILDCAGIEEVISNRDDVIYNNTTSGATLPDHAKFSQVDVAYGFPFQEVRKLEKLEILRCRSMRVIFEIEGVNNNGGQSLGKHSLECGLNFHFTNASDEATQQTEFHNSSMCSTPIMIGLLQIPWWLSNLIELDVNKKSKLLSNLVIFPHNELHKLQNLEKLHINLEGYSTLVEEIFEVVEDRNDEDVFNKKQFVVVFPKLNEVTLAYMENMRYMWKSNPRVVMNFPNLTKVLIRSPLLGHVFTSCMVGSLLQLQELQISNCKTMEVIIKQASADNNSDTKVNEVVVVVFPCLKSIKLERLPNLKGFCLGKEGFLLPSLDTLEIKRCPQITVLTSGNSTTPELKLIDTTFGLCYAKEDPTSFIKARQQELFSRPLRFKFNKHKVGTKVVEDGGGDCDQSGQEARKGWLSSNHATPYICIFFIFY